MIRRQAWMGMVIGAVAIAAAGTWGWSRTQGEFPHPRHQQMFPTCDGCHTVEPSGVTMPDASVCAGCHDGGIAPEVDWRRYVAPPSNLDFDHATVIAAKRDALGMDVPCSMCHVPSGAERMQVQRVVTGGCLGCHAPGEEHTVGAPCSTCHVPLAEAEDYSVDGIRAFPKPADHTDGFVLAHGSAATENTERCAVCHARELCSSCHVNAPEVAAIQSLPRDPRVAEIAAEREVRYPEPESHRSRDWLAIHGSTAGVDGASCAACHSQTSCRTCHVAPAPKAVRELPPGDDAGQAGTGQERGPGVALERRPPASHTATFAENHKVLAAAATVSCETCHSREACASCHTGSEALVRPGQSVASYHPDNFLEQHQAAAFSREAECSTCHNPEAFCRSCHAEVGRVGDGRIDRGFHDEKQTWVFGHGQAARQGLESCASCHAQRDCLVCHSALGGRRINPHGPDFDARRLRDKNPVLCLRCHRTSILDP